MNKDQVDIWRQKSELQEREIQQMRQECVRLRKQVGEEKVKGSTKLFRSCEKEEKPKMLKSEPMVQVRSIRAFESAKSAY